MNRYGDGCAYYVATALGPETLAPFLRQLCDEQNIAAPLPDLPHGVEVLPRVSPDDETLLYVLNHNAETVTFALPPGTFTDLLSSGEPCAGSVELPCYGVRILADGGASPSRGTTKS